MRLALLLLLSASFPALASESEVCDRHGLKVIDADCCSLETLAPGLKACVDEKQREAYRSAIAECEAHRCGTSVGGGCGHLYGLGYFPDREEFQSWVEFCEGTYEE